MLPHSAPRLRGQHLPLAGLGDIGSDPRSAGMAPKSRDTGGERLRGQRGAAGSSRPFRALSDRGLNATPRTGVKREVWGSGAGD